MNLDKVPHLQTQIDVVAALAALDGSRALLMDLATMFEEDAPAVLNELANAVEMEDAKEARRAVHSLRGLASTFFAFPTVEIARQYESDAAAGRLDALKNGGLDQLKQAIESLTIELRDRGLIAAR